MAGATAARCATAASPGRSCRGAAACSTDPHAWHSPQRPDHLVVRHPHSAHWKAGATVFAMGRTVPAAADTCAGSGPGADTPARPVVHERLPAAA